MPTWLPLRAARANRGFGTDEKRIRTKTTVMNSSEDGLGLSYPTSQNCNNGGAI